MTRNIFVFAMLAVVALVIGGWFLYPYSYEALDTSSQTSSNVGNAGSIGPGDVIGMRPPTVGGQGASYPPQPIGQPSDYQPPQSQTIIGYWECLPHKDTGGPHTMECAFGVALDKGDAHYAVDMRLMSMYPVDFPTGTKVRVSGVITPVEQLSSIQKYDIDGIISATMIEKL